MNAMKIKEREKNERRETIYHDPSSNTPPNLLVKPVKIHNCSSQKVFPHLNFKYHHIHTWLLKT